MTRYQPRLVVALLIVGALCLLVGVYSVFGPRSSTDQPVPATNAASQPTPRAQVREVLFTKLIKVPANTMWFDTGINVTGKYVRIKYVSGKWSNGGRDPLYADGEGGQPWPGLLVPNAPLRSLVGRTTKGAFYIGNSHEGDIGSGHLHLSMNDAPDSFGDNLGSLVVSVTVLDSAQTPSADKIVFTKTIEVPANQMWFNTGIDVTGRLVRIEYKSGLWSNKTSFCDSTGFPPVPEDFPNLLPKLIVPNAPLASLVGRTADGSFFIGNLKEGHLGAGNLHLSMNDKPGTFDDNLGSLVVQISFLE